MESQPTMAMLDADMLASEVQALRRGCHFAGRGMLDADRRVPEASCRSWNQTATNRGFRDKNAQLGLIRSLPFQGDFSRPAIGFDDR